MTTWGDIYRQHLRKGEDHGSAAYAADQWQKRRAREKERAKVRQIERDVLKRQSDPHIAGEACCVPCGHEFVSVAPVRTVWLACPSCKTERALMKFPCVRDDRPRWECHCGNNLFYVAKDGYYCPNCGDWQHGF